MLSVIRLISSVFVIVNGKEWKYICSNNWSQENQILMWQYCTFFECLGLVGVFLFAFRYFFVCFGFCVCVVFFFQCLFFSKVCSLTSGRLGYLSVKSLQSVLQNLVCQIHFLNTKKKGILFLLRYMSRSRFAKFYLEQIPVAFFPEMIHLLKWRKLV